MLYLYICIQCNHIFIIWIQFVTQFMGKATSLVVIRYAIDNGDTCFIIHIRIHTLEMLIETTTVTNYIERY